MAINTWDGAAGNTNWSDAGNWNTTGETDRVPTDDDDAIIPDTTSIQNCHLTADVSCKSLEIKNGATFDMDGNNITLKGKNANNRMIDLGSTITSATWDGTVSFIPDASSGTFRIHTGTNATQTLGDVVVNKAGTTMQLRTAFKCSSLTITAGTFDTYSTSDLALTVTKHIDVTGTLTGNASAISTGTMTLRDTSTLTSTGTITITGNDKANSPSGAGYIWRNIETDGTAFAPTAGKVHFSGTDNNGGYIFESKFYNVDVTLASTGQDVAMSGIVNDLVTIGGDLTVIEGTLKRNSEAHDITVTGDVEVQDGAVLGDNDETGATSFGSLTIASGATYKATSGITEITKNTAGGSASAVAFSQNGTGVFTHNSGTVKFSMGTDYAQIISGSATVQGPFYDVDHNRSSSSYHLYIKSDMTVENEYDNVQGYTTLYGPNTLTLGKSGSAAGSYKATGSGIRFYDNTSSNYAKVYGASVERPFVYTGVAPDIDTYSTNASYTAWKWGDIQVDLTGDYQGGTLRLDGDMEFDALTVNSGDTFDMNGQRAEFSGDVTYSGTWDADGLHVFHGGFTKYGTLTNAASGTIMTMSTSGYPTFSYITGYKTFFQNGGVQLGTGGFTNIPTTIVAGTTKCGTRDTSSTNLTIATGGDLQPTGNTVTVSGNWTSSGGLIGRAGLYCSGTYNAQFAHASDQSWDTGATASGTIEGWFKADSFGYQVLARSYGPGKWMLLMNTNDLEFFVTDNSNTNTTLTVTHGLSTDQWFHVACVASGTSQLMYINGKLVGARTKGAGLKAETNGWALSSNPGSSAYEFNGHIHQFRVWKEARTVSEIRDNMFTTSPTDSNDKLAANINFMTGGAGGTVTDAEGNGNGTLYKEVDGEHTTTEDAAAWAGAGTITASTSTVDFTGNGTITLNGDTDFYNLTVGASGKTTNLYNELNVASALYIVSGGTLTHGGGTFQVSGGSSGYYPNVVCKGTYNANADFENLYTFYWVGNSVSHVQPAGKFNYLIYDNAYNSGVNYDVTLAGNVTGSNYIAINDSCTLNTRSSGVDYNIDTARLIMRSNADLTLNNSTLTLTSATGFDFNNELNTLSAGPGCVISGSAADKSTFKSQNHWEVVGDIYNLDITNEELQVLGNVTNCTGLYQRWPPHFERNAILDDDTAEDRDLIIDRRNDLDTNTSLFP